MANTYDLFLSHNSSDKEIVEQLAKALRARGVKVFLDKWHLKLGDVFPKKLAEAIEASKAMAVCYGPSGESPWKSAEIQIAIQRAVEQDDRFFIFAVLLPGANCDEVDPYLRIRNWVDFRNGIGDAGIDSIAEVATRETVMTGYTQNRERQMHGSATSSIDIEFINRKSELDYLTERLKKGYSNFVLVNAPPGYGKTDLLHKLVQLIKENNGEDWFSCYVDCKVPEGTDQPFHIAQSLWRYHYGSGGFDGDFEEIGKLLTAEALCDFINTKLSASRNLLIVFDSIEHLKEASEAWFFELVKLLRETIYLGSEQISDIRIVVGGRDTETFQMKLEKIFPQTPIEEPLRLSPFRKTAIMDFIQAYCKKTGLQGIEEQTIEPLGDHVLHISGGHPEVVRNIVEHLASKYFKIPDINGFFEKNRLFYIREFVTPVAEEYLSSLDPAVKHIISDICLFRIFDAGVFDESLEKSVLDSELEPLEILKLLKDHGLLKEPEYPERVHRDNFMRPVLNLYKENQSDAKITWKKVHSIACDYYRNYISERYHQAQTQAIEWVYHALLGKDYSVEEFNAELEKIIADIEVKIDAMPFKDTFIKALEKDQEICFLRKKRFGKYSKFG